MHVLILRSQVIQLSAVIANYFSGNNHCCTLFCCTFSKQVETLTDYNQASIQIKQKQNRLYRKVLACD